jgi:hypothetical protein
MSDPKTLIYANFLSVVPMESEESKEAEQSNQESPEATKTPKKEKEKVYIKLSQPFDDKSSDKLDILGDFMQQMEVK